MSENLLIDEPIPGVKRLTINRPDAMNAFNFQMYKDFVDFLNQVKYEPTTRVVILTAAGNRAFCTGHDLKEPGTTDWFPEGLGKAFSTRYSLDLLCSIPILMRNLPQPIICGINGTVAGMAFAFTLASDLTLMAKSAKFVNAMHNAGTGAELGVSYMLPQLVGAQKAAEIMLTAKRVSSEEAEQIGLVLRSVPDEELQDACLELAKQIIVNTPMGIWVTKQSMWMNRSAGSLQQAIELESRGVFQAQSLEDKNEKRAAFFEKRDPVFHYK